jgi:hypothetical protein
MSVMRVLIDQEKHYAAMLKLVLQSAPKYRCPARDLEALSPDAQRDLINRYRAVLEAPETVALFLSARPSLLLLVNPIVATWKSIQRIATSWISAKLFAAAQSEFPRICSSTKRPDRL